MLGFALGFLGFEFRRRSAERGDDGCRRASAGRGPHGGRYLAEMPCASAPRDTVFGAAAVYTVAAPGPKMEILVGRNSD